MTGMPKFILICAPLLLAPLFAASAPGAVGALSSSALPGSVPPDEVMKDSDHKKVGELIGECIEASIARTGKHKAATNLRKALDKKWAKKAESGDPLSLTEDLQAALYYSINYSKARGVKKGKVAKFEIPAPFYGKDATTTFALWAPSKYNARQGPYPLVLCIPDADETPHEHLTERWADSELRKVCILVALQMPEKLENWGGRGVQGEPENTGGYALLMTTLSPTLDALPPRRTSDQKRRRLLRRAP